MKRTLVSIVAFLMVAIMATCTLASVEREETSDFAIMCIKDDGYAVTIAVRPDTDGTWTATIIDGSIEPMVLPKANSFLQTDEGIRILWEGSPVTILGAKFIEVLPN